MVDFSVPFATIVGLCQNSSLGKRLPDALYLHVSTLKELDPTLQAYEKRGRVTPKISQANLIKFHLDRPKISYLFYPDFEKDPQTPTQP